MKFFLVSLLIVTFGLAPTTKSHETSPISVVHYLRQERNSSSAEQQKQDSRGTNVTNLQTRLSWKDSSDTASTDLTPAVRKCTGNQKSQDAYADKWCKGANKNLVELANCEPPWGRGWIAGACATHLYVQTCPKMQCVYKTQPCPRKWIGPRYEDSIGVECDQTTGLGYTWHYTLYEDIKSDTLYDLQINVFDSDKKQWTVPYVRAKTCKKAEPIKNLYVVAYGLGWIYYTWRRPLEDCFAQVYYDEQYISNETIGNFSQDEIGITKDKYDYYNFETFHPCPKYPSWFCFIVSENIIPFHNVTFKIRSRRFQDDGDIDISDWVTIYFSTNDKGGWFPYCPKVNIFLTLWFLILLIIILLILLIVAAVLIALIYKAKKDLERLEDEPEYEEETIPPSNILEKIWERLRNFFDELCPTPQKPPPPPPPPPPKPKPKKKPIPKKKPKPKKMPKPKAKTPSPPPPPPPPPRPRKKKPSPPSPPPPPEPSGPKAKKDPRGARAETKGRDAAVMDTKRMASGVGGVRARRRR